MSNYYGYNAKTPDLSGIERAGQTMGAAIGQIPENVRNKKTYDDNQAALKKAAEMATKDWGSVETAAKSMKSTYQKKANALIEQRLYTKEQLDEDMQLIPIPLQAHKKNIVGYLNTLGTNYNTLLDKLDKISSGQQKGQVVGEAIGGSPAGMEAVGDKTTITPDEGKGFTEQDIQQTEAIPPATDQREAFRRAQAADPSITAEDFEKHGGKYVPSQEDITKRAQAKAKKTADTEMDELEREYKRAQIGLAKANKAKAYDTMEKMKQDLLLKEQGLQKVYDFKIVDEESKITKIDEEIKGLKEGEEQVGGGIIVDWDAINALERQKREKKRKISDLDARSKGVGQKPGETRKFNVGGGESVGKPKASTSRPQSALDWAQAQLAKNPQDPVALKVLAKAKRELGQ